MTDSKLYQLCKLYGGNARKWTREFAFLLPEVLRRGLHRRRGCQSIFEFASKLSGMNQNVVSRILNLHDKLRDYPLLWEQLRVVGWSKLEVIAGVVDDEKYWLEKLKMPKQALVRFVQEYKKRSSTFAKSCQASVKLPLTEPENGGALEFGEEFLYEQNSEKPQEEEEKRKSYRKLKFNVDEETEFLFRKFQQQIKKEKKQEVTMGETLKELLRKLGSSHKQQKACEKRTNETKSEQKERISEPRHISAQKKRAHKQSNNGKCPVPNCNNPATIIHHPDRYSLIKSHKNTTYICKICHQLAHSGYIENEHEPPQNWRILTEGQRMETIEIQQIDEKVIAHWAEN